MVAITVNILHSLSPHFQITTLIHSTLQPSSSTISHSTTYTSSLILSYLLPLQLSPFTSHLRTMPWEIVFPTPEKIQQLLCDAGQAGNWSPQSPQNPPMMMASGHPDTNTTKNWTVTHEIWEISKGYPARNIKLSDTWVYIIIKTCTIQTRKDKWPADFNAHGDICPTKSHKVQLFTSNIKELHTIQFTGDITSYVVHSPPRQDIGSSWTP